MGVALLGGGCGPDPATRIASLEAAVNHAETALGIAEGQITALQAQLTAAQAAGADSATLTRLQNSLADAMAQKPAIEQFIGQAKASLEKAKASPTGGGELELYVSLAVSALGLFGSAWFKRKAARQAGTLKAIVRGIEDTPADAKERVKVNIGERMKDAQIFDQANAIVDRIKAA
jgi:hypothetical protein